MPIKNTAITVTILIWDFGNNCGKTGQEANITLKAIGDLTGFTPSLPAIDEVDATNRKGEYLVTLTAGENNYDVVSVGGILTVAVTDCEIIPTRWVNDQIDFTTTQKASINTETDTALSDINLDHLAKTPTLAEDMTAEVADYTILARILSDGDTSKYDPSQMSFEAINLYEVANATFNNNKFSDNDVTIDVQLGTCGMGFRGHVYHAIPGQNQFRTYFLSGLGAGIFTDTVAPWYAYVLRDNGGLSALPQGEIRKITAYNTANGAFTTEAFSEAVDVGDDIIIMNPTLFTIPTIPAHVKGMDADVLTASALKADAVTEIVTGIKARVVDGTITGTKLDKLLLAFIGGRMVYDASTNTATFYDQSNVLVLTLPLTITGTTPVIA